MKKQFATLAGILLVFIVLAYGFVPQVLSGKIVNQSDISGWQGASREVSEWNAAHPEDPTAWTGSMFSGMPAATICISSKGDWTQPVYNLLMAGKRPASYLLVSLVGAFLLLLSLGTGKLTAAAGAVAVTFCSYNLQIIQVGHNTKMQALAFLPWVLAAMVFTYRSAFKGSDSTKKWLPHTVLGSALFGLTLSFQVKANHPQITYYLAIMIAAYAVSVVVWLFMDKERRDMWKRFLIASGLLLVLGCCGIATNAVKLLPTMEYTPYSTRGGSTAKVDGTKENKGLELDYATAWSYGWEELPNLLIPDFNGGSSAGAVKTGRSKTYELLKSAGQPNLKEVCANLPLYWGPQPFTAGPMYLGAVSMFLFILGLFRCRGKEKWWLLATTLLAVLLALGNHFMWFTKLCYDHAPLYNKFRTVSMALTLLQFTIPSLGFIALEKTMTDSSATARKDILLAGSVGAGICLLFAILQSIFGSFTSQADYSQPEVLVDALSADRRNLLWADTWRSVLLIAASAAVMLWGAGTKRTDGGDKRRYVATLLLGLLVIADLLPVGKRYLNSEDFVTPRSFTSQFNKRPVDEMILQDTDPSYRVLDLTTNVFNDSHPSYWHKSIGGYSPAKLQRYQEFIDSHLNGEIASVFKAIDSCTTVGQAEQALPELEGLSMLNCRYIIVGAQNPPLRYPYANGSAWFEDGSGTIEQSAYAPNEMRYTCESENGGKVVFSEIYYPIGWTLTLEDGTLLPIAPHKEILRCAEVPAGRHELVMRFDPPSYRAGEDVSRCCSIALILLVVLSAAAGLQADRKKYMK